MLCKVYCSWGVDLGSSVRLSTVWLCAALLSPSTSVILPQKHCIVPPGIVLQLQTLIFTSIKFFKMLVCVDKYEFGYTTWAFGGQEWVCCIPEVLVFSSHVTNLHRSAEPGAELCYMFVLTTFPSVWKKGIRVVNKRILHCVKTSDQLQKCMHTSRLSMNVP